MKIPKYLFLFSFFLFISFLFAIFAPNISAQEEFTVDASVTYGIEPTGKTVISHDITLENNFSTLYATSYSLTLENIDASNIQGYYLDESGAKHTLEVTSSKEDDLTRIHTDFPNTVVGKGAKRRFFINYDNSTFAVRTGEIWEVTIPRLDPKSTFRNYIVNLSVPASFGLEAYMSPKPQSTSQDESGIKYVFTKGQITQGAITAGFGPFQVFSFNLAYHLENPLSVSSQIQIAIPPDTAFQKIYFSSIDPVPQDVQIDPDGNWLALYKLSPKQRIDVKVVGSVQLFSGPRQFPQPSQEVLANNLKETEYWQVGSPQIMSLASQYSTPREIYDYVSSNLTYNFERVQPNVARLGALKALESPSQAICMEFTDTFIAIARAAGIPAREINGYAYTENPDLQPLGLVADVLHSWPEYYDKAKGVWVPIDPTWASTTGGENFFDKLDLRHFTFVIHGFSATKPYAPGSYKLGPNPQKDIFVSFGKLPIERISNPQIIIEDKKTIPFIGTYLTIKIKNPGNLALYNFSPTVYFDDKINYTETVEVLPPYASVSIKVKVPFSLLGKDTPEIVKITAQDSKIEIPTNKSQVVIISLASLFTLFASVLLLILVKLRKITFVRLSAKISNLYARIFRKSSKNQPT